MYIEYSQIVTAELWILKFNYVVNYKQSTYMCTSANDTCIREYIWHIYIKYSQNVTADLWTLNFNEVVNYNQSVYMYTNAN